MVVSPYLPMPHEKQIIKDEEGEKTVYQMGGVRFKILNEIEIEDKGDKFAFTFRTKLVPLE